MDVIWLQEYNILSTLLTVCAVGLYKNLMDYLPFLPLLDVIFLYGLLLSRMFSTFFFVLYSNKLHVKTIRSILESEVFMVFQPQPFHYTYNSTLSLSLYLINASSDPFCYTFILIVEKKEEENNENFSTKFHIEINWYLVCMWEHASLFIYQKQYKIFIIVDFFSFFLVKVL